MNEIEATLTSKARITGCRYLLQEKLVNHASLRNFGNDELITLRILSVVNRSGDINLYRPILLIPQKDTIFSYIHKGAIAIGINLHSGGLTDIMMNGSSLNADLSAALETGFILPYWDDIISMVVRAHRELSEIPLVGWDIAITDNMPVILEGNVSPSLDIHQLPPYGPFVRTDFYYDFIHNLKASLKKDGGQ